MIIESGVTDPVGYSIGKEDFIEHFNRTTQQPDYIIRPLDLADEPFLWEVLYHAVYVPEGSIPPPRQIINSPELARYVRGWGRAVDLGFLALDERTNQPIGAAWLRLMTGDEAGYGYVDDETPELSIALLPQHRGKGITDHIARRSPR